MTIKVDNQSPDQKSMQKHSLHFYRNLIEQSEIYQTGSWITTSKSIFDSSYITSLIKKASLRHLDKRKTLWNMNIALRKLHSYFSGAELL